MAGTTIIEFNCQRCGRSFRVTPDYAGRRARCKGCGASLVVPAPPAPSLAAAPAPAEGPAPVAAKVPMRLRRLRSDAAAMLEAFGKSGPIRLRSAEGDPCDFYELEYHVKGLVRDGAGEPKVSQIHCVSIQLTSDYPRLCPKCSMLTPIFHPNIADSTICVGDHWTAGERLPDLAIRIGEMIAYQAYNIKSPLDGEAAMWADLNIDKLPIDPTNMRGAGPG